MSHFQGQKVKHDVAVSFFRDAQQHIMLPTRCRSSLLPVQYRANIASFTFYVVKVWTSYHIFVSSIDNMWNIKQELSRWSEEGGKLVFASRQKVVEPTEHEIVSRESSFWFRVWCHKRLSLCVCCFRVIIFQVSFIALSFSLAYNWFRHTSCVIKF